MDRKFTLSDLKNGDVVLFRNKEVGIVLDILGSDPIVVCKYGWVSLDKNSYTEDLTSKNMYSAYDVMAVRRPEGRHECQFLAFERRLGHLVFVRKDPEEMTIEEVCKALGKNIRIVEKKENE